MMIQDDGAIVAEEPTVASDGLRRQRGAGELVQNGGLPLGLRAIRPVFRRPCR